MKTQKSVFRRLHQSDTESLIQQNLLEVGITINIDKKLAVRGFNVFELPPCRSQCLIARGGVTLQSVCWTVFSLQCATRRNRQKTFWLTDREGKQLQRYSAAEYIGVRGINQEAVIWVSIWSTTLNFFFGELRPFLSFVEPSTAFYCTNFQSWVSSRVVQLSLCKK